MAKEGPTTEFHTQRWAGNVLRLARAKRGITQRELAAAAGVAASTVGRIESGAVQPTLPTLSRLLAAVDLEMRIRVEDYDDHDDVLDASNARLTPAERAERDRVQEEFLAQLKVGRVDRQHA